jgi:hypothetical protein
MRDFLKTFVFFSKSAHHFGCFEGKLWSSKYITYLKNFSRIKADGDLLHIGKGNLMAYRCASGRFLMSPRVVATSNHNSLPSGEMMVNPWMRS